MSTDSLTECLMRGFRDELQKEAAPVLGAVFSHLRRPGTLHAMQAGMGSGLGLGIGAGAAVGAAGGGSAAYRDARDRGEGRVSSAVRAVGGAAGGAVRGAATGALVGATGGALAGAARPTNVISATRSLSRGTGRASGLSNFGQRQVHSLTGWRPGGSTGSIEQIGAGAATARQALDKAFANGENLVPHAKMLEQAEKSQRMGLTSLPGLARSVRDNGLLPTVGQGIRDQWSQSRPWEKALMVGAPAISTAATLASDDPGQGERLGRVAGGTLGLAAAPRSLAGGAVLGAGLERAGGAVGSLVDRLRARRAQVPPEYRPPPASEPGDTGTAAVEHVYGTGFGGSGQE